MSIDCQIFVSPAQRWYGIFTGPLMWWRQRIGWGYWCFFRPSASEPPVFIGPLGRMSPAFIWMGFVVRPHPQYFRFYSLAEEGGSAPFWWDGRTGIHIFAFIAFECRYFNAKKPVQ